MITTETMSRADMEKAERDGYKCAKCQSRVNVAWGGSVGFNGWILRCGKDINHTGVTRHDTKYEKIKREALSMNSTELTTMTETAMVARVGMAKFPKDLTAGEIRLLA